MMFEYLIELIMRVVVYKNCSKSKELNINIFFRFLQIIFLTNKHFFLIAVMQKNQIFNIYLWDWQRE